MFKIISLIAFLASFFISSNVLAFSIFDEGLIGQYTKEELDQSSNKVDFVNRVYADIFAHEVYDANSSQNELIRSSSRIDLVSQVYYDKKWFAYLNYRIDEQGLDKDQFNSLQVTPANGSDKFFEDQSGILRELNFGYEDDDYKFFVGKFRPKFGYAWNLGRGVFAHSLSTSYMQTNRLGFGGEVKAGDSQKTGAYNLGLSVYKYDRKYLDNSLITSRREVSQNDAAASDTSGLKSYTIHLDIDFDFKSGDELFYRFAYSKQKFDRKYLTGNTNIQTPYQDQKGYTLAMNFKDLINDYFAMDHLVEYSDVEFLEGNFNINRDSVFNYSLISKINDKYSLTTAYAHRRIKLTKSGLSAKNVNTEVILGYEFDRTDYFDGLQAQFGFVSTRTLNPLISTLVDDRRGVVVALKYVKYI